ncbi:MAG: 30S ribosome-binding factor RbfA [Candidatus Marinimicrobia bacterium]|nr:30S ribosome-binding factor RbfA [Candidatus Neomarinimicrobiota bacterium]
MNSATPYRRPDRVAQQILQILGEIASRNIDLSTLGFVTFTSVRITSDLKQAKVFFSVIQPKPNFEVVTRKLNRLSSAFRKYMGPALRIKFTPELIFIHDESLEYSEKMNRLLSDLHHPRDENDS